MELATAIGFSTELVMPILDAFAGLKVKGKRRKGQTYHSPVALAFVECHPRELCDGGWRALRPPWSGHRGAEGRRGEGKAGAATLGRPPRRSKGLQGRQKWRKRGGKKQNDDPYYKTRMADIARNKGKGKGGPFKGAWYT